MYGEVTCPICNKILASSVMGVHSHLRIHGLNSNEKRKVMKEMGIFRRPSGEEKKDIYPHEAMKGGRRTY